MILEYFHNTKEFPKECAAELVAKIRDGKLFESPGRTLVCILTLLAWAVQWAVDATDEGATPVIGTNAGPELAELCSELDCDVPVGGVFDGIIARQLKAALVKLLEEFRKDLPELLEKLVASLLDTILEELS